MTLASIINRSSTDLQLDRNSLTAQATDLLRELIISGHLPPDTKLVERELAELLGVSRMPAREALMNLEREGLVVAKNSGRYIIHPTRTDIEHLYQVRLMLECLAVELAAAHTTEENCRLLQANLQQLQEAVAHSDRSGYIRSDLEAHQLIWAQSKNPYLQKMLHSITGPIFLFIASHTDFESDWNQTLCSHEELAHAICAGNSQRAAATIRAQLQMSLQLSIRVFEKES